MATLNIRDLSIGDWIDYCGRHYKVYSIEDCGFIRAKCEDDYTSSHIGKNIDYLEPIHITAEILEKNGFAFKHKGIEFDHYETNLENGKTLLLSFDRGEHYYLMYEEKGERGLHQIDCPLGSGHQLQHALRLAGVEKEIVFLTK